MSFSESFFKETTEILSRIDCAVVEGLVSELERVRSAGGRVFFLGVGGSAVNASHAVNDFRKIVGLESYAPTDNVSELTARTNDEGWDTVFEEWLKGSHLNKRDAIFVLSVGGGDEKRAISLNIVRALKYAKRLGAGIFAIVGRSEGCAAELADTCVVIPRSSSGLSTAQVESLQLLVLHALVSHPGLKLSEMKWESLLGNSPSEPAEGDSMQLDFTSEERGGDAA